jgi:hypothetical protein|tara:strand:- start:1528 stop:3531 length:2004 start_codon:yes stop_codon:yes gene_type:complete
VNKNNFSILEYQSTNAPLFRENSNKLWIDCGADNLYPSYLEELYASSSMHGAIIKGVAEMIFGDGLNATNKDDHIEQWLKVKEIFGDEECLKKAAFDLKLYGQAFLNIIWSQDRTTISKVHHIPASTIRCGIADDEDNVPLFYHKTDWTELNTKPHVIPAFSSTDRTAASQIIHVKNYTPLSFYYGLPDYLPCTNYAQVEADLSAYHLSSINQGFFPSTIMNFNSGVPTEDERAELERLVYQKFGGANNAGKILMTFNDSQDTAPTIESFNLTDAHQVFDYLSEQCSKKVLSGHRVTSPLLFGVRDSGGGFGNNADEMKDAYDLFYNTVILPFQRLLLDALKPVFAASSVTLDMYFTPLKPASFIDTDNLFDSNAPDSRKRDASYDGGQIDSAMEIVRQVKEGVLSIDQAKVFLVQMLQFTPEVAEALFTDDSAIEQIEEEQDEQEATAQTQLSCCGGEGHIELKKKGTTLKERMREFDARLGKDYYYVRSEWVSDVQADAKLHTQKHLFYEQYANPEIVEQGSYGDILSREGFVFAVRYMYEETAQTPSQGGKSRDFCVQMMELSDEGVEYRYEDIVAMEGENAEFGHNGRPYSIWLHKGGIYCRHGFARNIYIYAPDGEPKEMDMVEIEGAWDDVMRRVGNNPEVVQRGEEYVAPIDTPSRGAYR